MKALILILLFSATSVADTLLDKKPEPVKTRVFSRDAFWNKTYREERRRNPGGTEQQWCENADRKVAERRAAARHSSLPVQRRVIVVE